jgi:glucose-1-phosphate thymidylyltransferase
MKIIIPMAGRGSRLRPHTLTTPKPLISVAGKPIVERLVEEIVAAASAPVDEIAFVIGDFGEAVEEQLLALAKRLGAQGHICYQDAPLGTAHAILCGSICLDGPVVIAFADTLFRANFKIDEEADGVLFVKRVDDPSAFGVVLTNDQGAITDYVEKPVEFVSDLAMIGIYAFKDGARLRKELQSLIDQDIQHGGEYQLPDALRRMTDAGLRFQPGEVDVWMDCGNKPITVETNARLLAYAGENAIDPTAEITDSVVIPPCFIGPGARVDRCVIGPHVTIGSGTVVSDSRVENALIQNDSTITNARLSGAMIGNHAEVKGTAYDLSIGDYSSVS